MNFNMIFQNEKRSIKISFAKSRRKFNNKSVIKYNLYDERLRLSWQRAYFRTEEAPQIFHALPISRISFEHSPRFVTILGILFRKSTPQWTVTQSCPYGRAIVLRGSNYAHIRAWGFLIPPPCHASKPCSGRNSMSSRNLITTPRIHLSII